MRISFNNISRRDLLKVSGIYIIYSGDDVPRYCGQTVNLYNRLVNHRSTLSSSNCFCNRIGIKVGESRKKSLTKYDDTWYIIINFCNKSELLTKEDYYHSIHPSLESRSRTGGHNPQVFIDKLPWDTGSTTNRSRLAWSMLPEIHKIWLSMSSDTGHVLLSREVKSRTGIFVDTQNMVQTFRNKPRLDKLLKAHSETNWSKLLNA